MSDLELVRCLGVGRAGSVLLANQSGMLVAVKLVLHNHLGEGGREERLLRALNGSRNLEQFVGTTAIDLALLQKKAHHDNKNKWGCINRTELEEEGLRHVQRNSPALPSIRALLLEYLPLGALRYDAAMHIGSHNRSSKLSKYSNRSVFLGSACPTTSSPEELSQCRRRAGWDVLIGASLGVRTMHSRGVVHGDMCLWAAKHLIAKRDREGVTAVLMDFSRGREMRRVANGAPWEQAHAAVAQRSLDSYCFGNFIAVVCYGHAAQTLKELRAIVAAAETSCVATLHPDAVSGARLPRLSDRSFVDHMQRLSASHAHQHPDGRVAPHEGMTSHCAAPRVLDTIIQECWRPALEYSRLNSTDGAPTDWDAIVNQLGALQSTGLPLFAS